MGYSSRLQRGTSGLELPDLSVDCRSAFSWEQTRALILGSPDAAAAGRGGGRVRGGRRGRASGGAQLNSCRSPAVPASVRLGSRVVGPAPRSAWSPWCLAADTHVAPVGHHLLLCLSITVSENVGLSATFPQGLALIM